MTRQRQQRGFSILEVLVAVVILTVGILGVAGTQLLALQQTGNANLRSQATMYAENVIDHVRANGGEIASDFEASIQRRLERELGEGASMSLSRESNDLIVTTSWWERDPFAVDGRSEESFTVRARVRR